MKLEFDLERRSASVESDFRSMRILIVVSLLTILIWPIFSEKTGKSLPTCMWLSTFHSPCPGCGMTRSIASLWHGGFLASWKFHPLGVFLFAGSFIGTIFEVSQLGNRVKSSLEKRVVSAKFAIFLFAIYMGVWLIRLALSHWGIAQFSI